jgi:two-component system nitrogen regulation sensor histidine kinase NtrY
VKTANLTGGPGPLNDDPLLEAELLHEMRHPLLGIKAGLVLLSRTLGPQLTGLDDFRLVTDQVGRLEELLRTWQDLFASPLTKSASFAVGPVVSRALDLFGHRVRPLGERFTYDGQVEATGYGIAQAFFHATSNVVANALDEAERSGGKVLVRVLDGEREVEVRVSDDGSGIDDAHRELVFEPRFTTKDCGNGLGLYIAQSLMHRCGGQVRLVDEGDSARAAWARTEFAISVPKVQA